jgi:hypothetical protein
MDATAHRSTSRLESFVCSGIAVFSAAMTLYTWTRTGHPSDLLLAMASIAISPVWYIRPISFTLPIRQELKPRPEPAPQWATIMTTVFLTLLWASLVVRWVS